MMVVVIRSTNSSTSGCLFQLVSAATTRRSRGQWRAFQSYELLAILVHLFNTLKSLKRLLLLFRGNPASATAGIVANP